MVAGIKLVIQLILGLAMFAGVLWLSYAATKNISKRLSLNGKGGQNLKIIESVSTGRESSLMIVKAGRKYLLVGMTSGSMTLISELSSDDIESPESMQETAETMDFSEALKINIARIMNKKNNGKIQKEEKNDEKQDS